MTRFSPWYLERNHVSFVVTLKVKLILPLMKISLCPQWICDKTSSNPNFFQKSLSTLCTISSYTWMSFDLKISSLAIKNERCLYNTIHLNVYWLPSYFGLTFIFLRLFFNLYGKNSFISAVSVWDTFLFVESFIIC